MQSNVHLACDCPNYAKYKTFYDEALAYESSLYWDFAKCLLTCSAIGIVLFFLFAFVRIRTIEELTSSFGRRQSGKKMKRSQSTSQVTLPSETLSTPVLSSSVKDDSPVFTSPFAVGDDLNRSTRVLEPISPTTLSPASARNPECSSAPAVLEYVQGRPAAPPTARRPSLNFAKSLHDISMSMGPRSPSTRFPLPRRASARSFLGIHVEEQEGETEV